ncbi:Suppressor of tumorigenicity 14 protein [Sarracenia purpurea var. burkii]
MVSLGDSRENADNEIGGKLIANEQYDIIKIHDHPRYDALRWRNDISIFELSTKVTMNLYIRPACLLEPPTDFRYGTGTKYATGYPRNNENLVRTTVDDIDEVLCSTLYKSKDEFYQEYDPSTMICVRNLNDNPQLESCMVESGGPLQIHVQKEGMECMFNVVGVMTTAKKCLDNDGVTIYTKVDPYIDWIQNIVWP